MPLSGHPTCFRDRSTWEGASVLEILTVCTGNICRSPLAELLLRQQLDGIATVSSAGVRAMVGEGMPDEAAELAAKRGVPASDIAQHRARWLNESHLKSPDLVLAMAREHRRAVVELSPSRIRSAFTAREFERLAERATDASLIAAADAAGSDPHERFAAVLQHLAGRRGLVAPPADPTDDDVVDPYRRSIDTYELSAAQLDPALAQVIRLTRIAAGKK